MQRVSAIGLLGLSVAASSATAQFVEVRAEVMNPPNGGSLGSIVFATWIFAADAPPTLVGDDRTTFRPLDAFLEIYPFGGVSGGTPLTSDARVVVRSEPSSASVSLFPDGNESSWYFTMWGAGEHHFQLYSSGPGLVPHGLNSVGAAIPTFGAGGRYVRAITFSGSYPNYVDGTEAIWWSTSGTSPTGASLRYAVRELESWSPARPCNPADVAEPYGLVDVNDVVVFVNHVNGRCD